MTTTDTDTHTDELVNYGAPPRLCQALIRAGLETAVDVFDAPYEKLLGIRNVGRSGWRQIEAARERFYNHDPLKNKDETVAVTLHLSPVDYARVVAQVDSITEVPKFMLHAIFDAAGITHK